MLSLHEAVNAEEQRMARSSIIEPMKQIEQLFTT
jgi:hypothetical protein